MSIEANRGVTPSTELPRLLMTFLRLVTDGCGFSGTASGVGTVGTIILKICHRHFQYKRGRESRFLAIVKIKWKRTERILKTSLRRSLKNGPDKWSHIKFKKSKIIIFSPTFYYKNRFRTSSEEPGTHEQLNFKICVLHSVVDLRLGVRMHT